MFSLEIIPLLHGYKHVTVYLSVQLQRSHQTNSYPEAQMNVYMQVKLTVFAKL